MKEGNKVEGAFILTKGAWDDIITLPLGYRRQKPRNAGVTMVIDKGLGYQETKDLLDTSGDYIDFLKLGFGTSAFYSKELLLEKIKLAKKYDVEMYPGGTFLEVAYWQGRIKSFLDRAKELGFETIEVSDGTITLKPNERKEIIDLALERGFKVLTEVGKKDAKAKISITNLLEQAQQDLEWGAWKVIMEGRESGKGIGLYDKEGNVMEDKLEEFISKFSSIENIIWEAPLKNQQVDFITRFGVEVNLGNIASNEILALEALRTGLRGDTLGLVVEYKANKEGFEVPPVLKKLVAAWSLK